MWKKKLMILFLLAITAVFLATISNPIVFASQSELEVVKGNGCGYCRDTLDGCGECNIPSTCVGSSNGTLCGKDGGHIMFCSDDLVNACFLSGSEINILGHYCSCWNEVCGTGGGNAVHCGTGYRKCSSSY